MSIAIWHRKMLIEKTVNVEEEGRGDITQFRIQYFTTACKDTKIFLNCYTLSPIHKSRSPEFTSALKIPIATRDPRLFYYKKLLN